MIFEKKVIDTFKRSVVVRQDTPDEIFIFSREDFPGLNKEEFIFRGNRNQKLVGAFYYYGEKSNGHIVIFEHGIGGGHRSYMKEIDALSSRGFTVLTYDHTGCMESEGEDIGGFSQSLADLDALIRTLKLDEGYKDMEISVVGHSWGAYSTLNIAKYHPDIKHIVAMSGFISVKSIFTQFMSGILKFYVKSLVRHEERTNPGYAYASADTALLGTDVKALIIHSVDDPRVSYELNFGKLLEAYRDRPDTEFLSLVGRKHNPSYTDEAIEKYIEFSTELSSKRRAGALKSAEEKREFREKMDWNGMTEQDGEIWDKISEFLRK